MREWAEILPGGGRSTCPVQIQVVKRNHIGIELFIIRIVDGFFPTDGFGDVFDHLAGGIPQRGGPVEDRRDKRIPGMGEKELRGKDLYIVMKIIVLANAGEIVLILLRLLCFQRDGDIALGFGIGDLHIVGEEILQEEPGG